MYFLEIAKVLEVYKLAKGIDCRRYINWGLVIRGYTGEGRVRAVVFGQSDSVEFFKYICFAIA